MREPKSEEGVENPFRAPSLESGGGGGQAPLCPLPPRSYAYGPAAAESVGLHVLLKLTFSFL